MNDDLHVHHRAGERGAFTVDRGSDELGTLTYHRHERTLTLIDTAIANDIQGQGAGAALIKAAVNYAKEAHLDVEVECVWAKEYLERHPDLLG
ncbi:MAG: GNAT family N-acetyltransferase [Myxococcota bacterium]